MSPQKDPLPRLGQARRQLAQLESQYATALNNMTLEADPALKAAMRSVVVDLQTRLKTLKNELQAHAEKTIERPVLEVQIAAALREFEELPRLADDPENLPAIGELFQRVDVQLFLRFQPVQLKKRIVNRLSDGILTMGSAPAPIQKYQGATSREQVKETSTRQNKTRKNKKSPAANATGPKESNFTDDQENSSGNVNRDDKTPIELFIAGVRGWEVGLCRFFVWFPDDKRT